MDLIGPYRIKAKDGTILDFMCLTMIDPATGWFEIIELPNTDVTYVKQGEEITKVIIDKSSAIVSRLFNKCWLSCYPRAHYRQCCMGIKIHIPHGTKNYAWRSGIRTGYDV